MPHRFLKSRIFLGFIFLAIIVFSVNSVILFADEVVPTVKKITVQAGTKIPITLRQTISSALNSIGETVCLTVDNDIIVNGVVAIKKDTLVLGRVNVILKSRPVNKPGDINFVVNYIGTIDGQNLPTEKEILGNNGKRRTGAMAANIFLWGVFGLLTKGADAVVPMGTGYDLTITSNAIEIDPSKLPNTDNSIKPDISFNSTIDDKIIVGSLKESRMDIPITVDFKVPAELIQLLPRSANNISITKISDFALPRGVIAQKVTYNESKNIITITFPRWNAVQYSQAGQTNWEILFKLNDGKTASGKIVCETQWPKSN
jgi:hypothetical protein